MKIAVTGKGGVGKTTIAATLARLYAKEGKRVIAADADPDANLALALGFTEAEADAIVPITAMKKMIAKRTGVTEQNTFFKINPRVDDIPEIYSREHEGVKLLVLGTVETAGGGCICPENVILKQLISNLILYRDEVAILDMEAGLEHLGRGTTQGMDQFIVVIEPGARSIQTYRNVKRLAKDLGVPRVGVIANKIRDEKDEAFIRSKIAEEELLGLIHFNSEVIDADRHGISPFDCSPGLINEIISIKERIEHLQ